MVLGEESRLRGMDKTDVGGGQFRLFASGNLAAPVKRQCGVLQRGDFACFTGCDCRVCFPPIVWG